MTYTKNYKFGIGFGKIGRYAYKGDHGRVWKLGIHPFICDGSFIFRVCYLRTNKATHYWQFHIHFAREKECGSR